MSVTLSAASDASPEVSRVPMDRLPQGSGGIVTAMDLAEADLQRLQVMGICPGRWVQVVRQGDPLIVRVLGTRLGLAAILATMIYVSPCAAPLPAGA